MGTFKVKCPSCNQKLEADKAWEGMELPCPKCNHLFSLHKTIPQLRIAADEYLAQNNANQVIIPESITKENPPIGDPMQESPASEKTIKEPVAKENSVQLEQLI